MVKRSLVLLVIAGRVAAAQPGATEPAPVSAKPALLDEDKAMWLTVGGTLGAYTLVGVVAASEGRLGSATVPLALTALAGTLVAPTFGHWYAGAIVTRGLGLRLGAVAATYVAASMAFGCGHESSGDCRSNERFAVPLMIAAGGLWFVGTFDDFIQAKRRVVRINEARLDVSLVPVASHESMGFSLVGRF